MNDDSLKSRLSQIDRRIQRDQLREKIRELGGMAGGMDNGEVSEAELSFLERVVAWETGPRSSHRAWLARHGRSFVPPVELDGADLKTELWRLIRALAEARVFLYHTNHLTDAELYARLWTEVLQVECPDVARSRDDACHCDFADAGGAGEEIWLRFYANPAERAEWKREFPEITLPERRRPLFRRDHRLPRRD
jgi:hypothetical protein